MARAAAGAGVSRRLSPRAACPPPPPWPVSWLLRVFARGTQARPSFSSPEGVAGWWVRTLPSPAKLVAVKRWPRPAFDRRDRRQHQLLVIAYSPTGHPAVRDRLGMFVTAVRDRPHGPWRLLEATVAP